MNTGERQAAFGLAAILGLRMLGLFLILPVFALYGDELGGSTALLIGIAIGAYGLTQAVLQVPVGMLSDRIGRRPVIIAGLWLFVAGSVLAALSDHIYGVIAGRALQGAGAISAAVMALAADLTRDSQRTKAMAVIGISVGAAFMLALVVGPIVAGAAGLSGIFWLTAALALGAIALMWRLVPEGVGPAGVYSDSLRYLGHVLKDPDLLRLAGGIFALHLMMTATFVALPTVLGDNFGLAKAEHWQVYIPVLLLSVVGMAPLIGLGERSGRLHRVVPGVMLAMAVSLAGLAVSLASPYAMLAALLVYFTAVNTLEATLPSLVSKFAPGDRRGAALGMYSTAQFMGAFAGGALGGGLFGAYGAEGVFMACAVVGAVWFVFARGLRAPGGAHAAEAAST